MYQKTMDAIHTTLLGKGMHNGMTYTKELIPERTHEGQVYDLWRDITISIIDVLLDRGGCLPSKIILFAS